MRFEDGSIPLSGIDANDDTYRITTRSDIHKLAASIQTVGLIAPPLVIPVPGQKAFRIISGFRRFAACRMLGWKTFDVRIGETEYDPLECIRLAISDNVCQRTLNLIEIARAIYLLSRHIASMSDLAAECQRLDLAGSSALIRKMLVVNDLPATIKQGILSDSISMKTAIDLGALPDDAGVTLARVFQELKLSFSKQTEIILMLKEIGARENKPIMAIFEESEWGSIITNGETDRNQKAGQLRKYIKCRRFPVISDIEKRFNFLIKNLDLGRAIHLVPPRNFEGTNWNFRLDFTSLDELREAKNILARVIDDPALKDILSI